MGKFITKFVGTLFLLVASCFGQTQAPLLVNGATNPTAIPDNAAYSLVFRMLAAPLQTPTSTRIGLVGLTTPADVTALTNSMGSFATQAFSQQPPDQLALGQQYLSQLQVSMTATGIGQLQTFVQAQKSRAAEWGMFSKGCTGGVYTLYTYTYAFSDDYGDSNSDWDFYGDGIGVGTCNCSVTATGSSLTIDSNVTHGVVRGSTTYVEKIMANGGTSLFAGTGAITTEYFSYYFYTGCVGSVVVTWSIQNEFAYTKFANVGLRLGGGCQVVLGSPVCTYSVTPICTNTNSPDWRYPGGPIPDAWIRDYDFLAWRSVGVCTRVVFGSTHSTWLCINSVVGTIGTGDLTPGICTYNP